MLVLIMLSIQIVQLVLMFRLLKKGSFVTVENKVIYVPAKKKKPQIVQAPEDDYYE